MAVVRYMYDQNDIVRKPYERIITEAEFTQFYQTYKPISKEW